MIPARIYPPNAAPEQTSGILTASNSTKPEPSGPIVIDRVAARASLTAGGKNRLLAFLSMPENLVFAGALALMLLIGLIEAIGLGIGGTDFDFGLDHDGLLSWLGVGRVPLLALLVAFLASFGLIGLAGQQIAYSFTGWVFPPLIGVPAAAVAALPVTSLLSRFLARVMPQDETTAIDVERLVGLAGTIVVGRATPGFPARTRVQDQHGQAHYVMAEPDNADQILSEGDQVLLVRREAGVFRAIPYDNPRFSEWIQR
jgi:hypothetical protein